MITAGDSAFSRPLRRPGEWLGRHGEPAPAAAPHWMAAYASLDPASGRCRRQGWSCRRLRRRPRSVWLCERMRGPPSTVPRDRSRLPDRGTDRRRRHGRGLPGPAALPEPPRRDQDDARQQHRRRQGPNYFRREIQALRDMLMPGGKCHPEHRRVLRALRDRRPVPARHGVRRRQERAGLGPSAQAAAADRERPPRSASSCSRRWITPTPRAMSTATSSRRTCWSWARSTGPGSSSPTSAWPRASSTADRLHQPDRARATSAARSDSSRPTTSASSARSRSRPTSTARAPRCSTC